MGKRELSRAAGRDRKKPDRDESGHGARSSRKKGKKGARVVISRVLIFGGLGLMVMAIAYELANYPWQILFQGPEEFKIDTLPDPPPPDFDSLVEYDPSEDYADWGEETSAPELPGAETLANFADGAKPSIVCSVIGAVKIPKLGVSVNLMDGYTQTHLLLGAGYVNGTAKPGASGNCSISGHRVTARMHPFRHLDKMDPGDYVFVKYDGHTYIYETVETFVVGNTEKWVMDRDPTEKYMLTLITCHPVGSARQRFILRGRLIDIDGLSPDEFYERQAAASPPPDASDEPSDTPPDVTNDPEDAAPSATPDTTSPPVEDDPTTPEPTRTPTAPPAAQTPGTPLIIGPDSEQPIDIPSDDGT